MKPQRGEQSTSPRSLPDGGVAKGGRKSWVALLAVILVITVMVLALGVTMQRNNHGAPESAYLFGPPPTTPGPSDPHRSAEDRNKTGSQGTKGNLTN